MGMEGKEREGKENGTGEGIGEQKGGEGLAYSRPLWPGLDLAGGRPGALPGA